MTKRIEQWVAFEERQTWEAGVHGRTQPSISLAGVTELGVGGAQAVGGVVVAILRRHTRSICVRASAGRRCDARTPASAALARADVDADWLYASDCSIVSPRSTLPE
jgi:hypothetical protein